MKIYLAVNDWSTEDASGISTYAFDTLEKAKEEISKWIEEEKRECWDQAFDENGELLDGYELEQTALSWEIWESGYYISSHTRIEIRILEVL